MSALLPAHPLELPNFDHLNSKKYLLGDFPNSFLDQFGFNMQVDSSPPSPSRTTSLSVLHESNNSVDQPSLTLNSHESSDVQGLFRSDSHLSDLAPTSKEESSGISNPTTLYATQPTDKICPSSPHGSHTDFDFSNNSPSKRLSTSPFKHSTKSVASHKKSMSSLSILSSSSTSHSMFTPPISPTNPENSQPLILGLSSQALLQSNGNTIQHSESNGVPTDSNQPPLDRSEQHSESAGDNTKDSNDNRGSNDDQQDNNNPNSEQFLNSLSDSQPPTGYPFLRALHAFDASSLSSDVADPEEDPASICLTFQESEIVLLHSIHPSGWGDATILSTGARGWIPTNYFTPYTDPKVTPLLLAVLGFVLNPKSQPLTHANGLDSAETEFSFSQGSITNIVAGVRSLLESCGALTRDTQIIRRSQAIRKFRKILLAELAILVSLAKQYRNTTEDANIERLVTGSYKIISRAVLFVDIWTIDTSHTDNDEPETHSTLLNAGTSSIDNLQSAVNKKSDLSPDGKAPIETIHEVDPSESKQVEAKALPVVRGKSANRESVLFHGAPPYARQRLDEVNDALTSYLGNFIHRMTVLETDPTACTQILVNTRKSMLACRELLAAVEAISSRSLPRNKELESSKDNLFSQIRTLVTAARDVVASTPASADMLKQAHEEGDEEDQTSKHDSVSATGENKGHYSAEGQRLIDIATECARTSGECVVRCRFILEKIGDFQLSAGREYPDFSDGVIAVPNHRKRTSLIMPKGSTNPSSSSSTLSPHGSSNELDKPPSGWRQSGTDSDGDNSSLLPHIPVFSPIITTNGDSDQYTSGIDMKGEGFDKSRISAVLEEDDSQMEASNEIETREVELPSEEQVIIDDNGRVRGGSLDGLVRILTDENVEQDPSFVSTFFLTFRQFSNALDFSDALVRRFGADTDETKLNPEELDSLIARRTKIYNVFKKWMECYWKHPADAVVLPQIVNFANSHLSTIPNAKSVLNDLTTKVQQIPQGHAIVPTTIPVPRAQSVRMSAVAYSQAPYVGTTVTKHLSGLLIKAVAQGELNGNIVETSMEDDSKSLQSGAGSTWSTSLRMVKANPLSSVIGSQLTILDIEPADVAKELCLIDSHAFCRIKPEELLDLNFSTKRRHLGLAPNVHKMTSRSNQLSSFVGDSILSADVPTKMRRNLLKHWIKIGEKLLELHNYNSLMTIISALQSVNIMRLKKTWEMLSPRYNLLFQELKNVVSMEKNYMNYRALLRQADIPTLPYLGLYLTDLTFVVEGNSSHRLLAVDKEGQIIPPGRKSSHEDKSSRGSYGPIYSSTMVINFDRYERTTRIIGEVQMFQVPYRVAGSPELHNWLKAEMMKAHSSVSKDHNNLWRRSCIVEPK